jgi:hypothetical protein
VKERHLRYAHRVHAATRRHSLRLGTEIRRQRAEAAAIREGLGTVRSRREALRLKLEHANAVHQDIRDRLRQLAKAGWFFVYLHGGTNGGRLFSNNRWSICHIVFYVAHMTVY